MLIATLFACVNPPPQPEQPPAVSLVSTVPDAAVAVAPVVTAPVAAPPPAAAAPVVAGLGVVLPEFTLFDRNPKSPGNGQPVSPKDYVGSAAGYYFTHAT